MSLPSEHWLPQSIIYQIFTGRWSSASLVKHPFSVFGRLASLDYSQLSKLDIDTIYLLGIFDNRGPIIVNQESSQDITHHPQRLPSPFSITNHSQPNPFFGSIPQLKHLISRFHSQGFKVIIDFVPNHTSTVHPWVKTHPDFYLYQDGNHIAEFNSDVYKLNYQNLQLRHSMIAILNTIANWGVDGVRCDMAHLIPLDFWQQATAHIKSSHPNFAFIAEAYPDSPFDLSILYQLLDSGFDAVYHGLLQKNLEQVVSHHQPLNYLTGHLDHIIHHFPKEKLVNFVANHDDPVPSGVGEMLEAAMALTLFFPGTPFVYNGLLNYHLPRLAHHFYDQLDTKFQEINQIDPRLAELFRLKTKHQPIIKSLTTQGQLVICQLKLNSGQANLFLNFSPHSQTIPQLSSNLPGLIHQLSSNQPLSTGQAEIILQ